VSSTKPGLTPVPSTVTPLDFARASISPDSFGAVSHGYAHSSAMVITFLPLWIICLTGSSVSPMKEETARRTTSASCESTSSAFRDTGIFSCPLIPVISLRGRPAFPGDESRAPTSSTPSFPARICAMSVPIVPIPQTITLMFSMTFCLPEMLRV